jgi:ubiquinone/menaquinone biosynthesis C-methylase UbiE
MAVPFDHIASTSDSVLTRSAIGQLQRRHLWNYVERVIPQLKELEMLELNNGGGDDALLFTERGFNIVATDISEEMLKITPKKDQYSMSNYISSHYLDLDNINETLFNKKFDLVISNFGGINSINPESLKKLFERLPSLLKPGGRFIAVVMPRFCVWETIFFLLRLQFKKAFRRFSSKEGVNEVIGSSIKTWFYQPRHIRSWTTKRFKVISVKPVGVALPSTYLEKFFSLKKRWLINLNKFEKRLNRNSILSGMSDNFIIDLQLR